MPGLSVTLAQAARLWNVDRRRCLDVLEALTKEGFLYRAGESVRANELRPTAHVEEMSRRPRFAAQRTMIL